MLLPLIFVWYMRCVSTKIYIYIEIDIQNSAKEKEIDVEWRSFVPLFGRRCILFCCRIRLCLRCWANRRVFSQLLNQLIPLREGLRNIVHEHSIQSSPQKNIDTRWAIVRMFCSLQSQCPALMAAHGCAFFIMGPIDAFFLPSFRFCFCFHFAVHCGCRLIRARRKEVSNWKRSGHPSAPNLQQVHIHLKIKIFSIIDNAQCHNKF